MTLDQYILECESNLKKFENIEEYEWCQELHDFINCLKEKDVKKYIDFCFDVKTLTKAGFFKKGFTDEQIEKRLVEFFGLESIFEYSLIGGSSMCFFGRKLKEVGYGING